MLLQFPGGTGGSGGGSLRSGQFTGAMSDEAVTTALQASDKNAVLHFLTQVLNLDAGGVDLPRRDRGARPR